ncbi:hypothetical protein C6P45_005329 [Maudiozyma exigua]|uniref:TECPR1-like DysF domain-containing protein n=1 Tax=Maudiozyma exigua TaxID=34358 RepID=A0A9P6W8X1_MAUEX|nr:hypothetical protein C6P45_005329 [Kazachstania exigua]
MSTPPVVLKALSNIYPLLIVIDQTLNNMLWITNDVPHIFVNIVFVSFSIRFLLITDIISVFDIGNHSLLIDYIGLLSTSFYICSLAYYIYSVASEIQNSEPPTADDLVILIENVQDKLFSVKKDFLNLFPRNNDYKLTFQWITLATSIQTLIFKFNLIPYVTDTTSYLIMCFVLMCIFHTHTFQGVLEIIWRLKFVRSLYVWWSNDNDKLYTKRQITPLGYFDMLISDKSYITVKMIIQSSEEITQFTTLRTRLIQLCEAEDRHENNTIETENIEKTPVIPSIEFNILKFCIEENQRKWNNDTWEAQTLPFERSNFTVVSSCGTSFNSDNPLTYDKQIPSNWIKLDDIWHKSSWDYCNKNWSYIGKKDSPECFTRTRVWSFRYFQKK